MVEDEVSLTEMVLGCFGVYPPPPWWTFPERPVFVSWSLSEVQVVHETGRGRVITLLSITPLTQKTTDLSHSHLQASRSSRGLLHLSFT